MKISKTAPTFAPVTVTFETAAEAAAVRAAIGTKNMFDHARDADLDPDTAEARELNEAMYVLYSALNPESND